MELFKHRAQAGQIQGSMMTAVTTVLKAGGPAALYGSFFIPFLFKSLPFDIAELTTYSCLNDWRSHHNSSSSAAAAAAAASKPAASAAAVPASSSSASLPETQQQQLIEQQQPQFQATPALASLTAASLSSSSSNSGSWWPSDIVQNMPDHVWDMTVGAAAGATAVLISHPNDCIKTVMVSCCCRMSDCVHQRLFGDPVLFCC